MDSNETSSYKKAERLLFKQNCLKRSLSYVELQVGFELTEQREQSQACLSFAESRRQKAKPTYDLLITSELHYHCAIEALGSLMGIEPTTTRATTWHSTN